ncbi:MAG: nucleotidyltransferase family protein [bacterium]
MRNSKPKSLDELVGILRQQRQQVRDRFRTTELAIFGSYLRKKQHARSDIDLLVEFEPGYQTFDNYMELKFFLESLLHAKIDLITKASLRQELRNTILAEAVYV